jgi:hypothetical protein
MMFVLVWINFDDAIQTFHFQKDYAAAKQVFLFIGLLRIIDMGTGVNSQIIGTSIFWRFEFTTGVVLMLMTLPMNYMLTKSLGVTGPAIANLITFTIYNGIRYTFLWIKFKLQPFNAKSFYILLLGFGGFVICDYLFSDKTGLGWMVLRSVTFLLLFAPMVLLLKVSPDIMPVWMTVRKRLKL